MDRRPRDRRAHPRRSRGGQDGQGVLTELLVAAMARIPEAQERVAIARGDARERAILAIRAIEGALLEALEGEHLRGLLNLGDRVEKFHGVRVRHGDAKATLSLTSDERPLVLGKEGLLVFARWAYGGEGRRDRIEIEAAQDDELLVEDLESMIRTVRAVVEGHVAALGRTSDKFRQIVGLADLVLEQLCAGTRVPDCD